MMILGSPQKNPVGKPLDGSDALERHNDPCIPQYLVYPVEWLKVSESYLCDEPYLIDFGESYEMSDPPQELGTPAPYRSPELILDSKAGVGCDLRALGCTLFEIRTGRKLFQSFDNDDDEYLERMIQVLGKMPEPWWSNWEFRVTHYEDEVDREGHVIEKVPTEVFDNVHPSIPQGCRSLEDKLAPGLWYTAPGRWQFNEKIGETEVRIFADLLHKLLRFDPEDRISAKEALGH